jgi:formylglycine-generating enzyme required for sulfatase activity
MGADPLIGRTIGSYRIERTIGEGGMGVVYEAVHVGLERKAAVKVLPERIVRESPDYAQRFLLEAHAAAKVNHPNIVQVNDAGQEGGVHYIAMELVRGPSVSDLIHARTRLPELEALRIVQQAARGLRAALNREIIHRDVKSANLLITEDGIVKVADFGLAKNLQADTGLTASGHMVGTPAYISPEQGRGDRADFRSDIYSLGVTLFEMVTGQRPFVAETHLGTVMKHLQDPIPDPTALEPSVSPLTRLIIYRMMAKQPGDRYASYEELSDTLTATIARLEAGYRDVGESGSAELPELPRSGEDTGTPSPPTIMAPTGQERKKQMPLLAIIVGAVVLAAAVVVVVIAVGGFGGDGETSKENKTGTAEWEQRALETAEAFHDEGEYDSALTALDRILEKNPGSSLAGKILELKKRWKAEQAGVERQARIQGLVESAKAFLKSGDVQEARAEVSAIRNISPGHPAAEAVEKEIQRIVKEREAAKAQKAYSDQMSLYSRLFTAAQKSDRSTDWARVVECLQKAFTMQPGKHLEDLLVFARAKELLARALEVDKAGDFREALKLARRAGELGADVPGLQQSIKRVEKMLAGRVALADRMDKFQALVREAEALEKAGGDEDILRAWKTWQMAGAAAVSNQDRRLATDRARALAPRVEVIQAREKLYTARAAASKAVANQDWKEARKQLKEVVRLAPQDAGAKRELGEVQYKFAVTEGAKAEKEKRWLVAHGLYREALEARPGEGALKAALNRVRRKVTALSRPFAGKFLVPECNHDRFGNLVNMMHGARVHARLKLPYEIWLVDPPVEFVLIPPGEFLMGSPRTEEGRLASEGPPRIVRFEESFYMAKYEVTQDTWQAVMGKNPSRFKESGEHRPAEQIAWKDAKAFIRALRERTAGPRGRKSFEFFLPSEAEWEYAARAGSTSRFSGGPGLDRLERLGWYEANAGGTTHTVGGKKPNDWTLYDMHGNVSEWCEDPWHNNLYGAPRDGSVFHGNGSTGTLKGGSWFQPAKGCRSAFRFRETKSQPPGRFGMRPVLILQRQVRKGREFLSANLLRNGGCEEEPRKNGELPGWTCVKGKFVRAKSGFINMEGEYHFHSGHTMKAEMHQDIPLKEYLSEIRRGRQEFAITGYISSGRWGHDRGQILVQYLDRAKKKVLERWDSAQQQSKLNWIRVYDRRTAPRDAYYIRVKLYSYRRSTSTNDALYDDISVKAVLKE